MLHEIEMIANTTGNQKIKELQEHPRLIKTLEYAYDPHKKFYITAPDIDGVVNGSDDMSEAFDILDRLASRELSGQAALEEVSDMIVSLTPYSAEVFKRILNKDLRAGINVKSINKAWSGLIKTRKPTCMLLKNFDEKKVKFPVMAAVKKDGVRARYINGVLLSRQGKVINGMDHILDQLKNFNHELDGELCIAGEIFDVASGMIRSDNDTPESVYYVFDVPSLPCGKLERYQKSLNIFYKSNPEFNAAIQLINTRLIQTTDRLIDIFDWALEQGEEGIVIYDPDSLYEDKRSYDWTRMVPIKSADCKVIGFFEGKGKHAGSLGGIIISYNDHVVRVGTGFAEKVTKTQLKQLVTDIDKNILT